ncbi:O-antigen ligase family protein [Rhizorhabdus argentea]|uniref:O-antigen ligase family protein n=1 Tax=Rhizorhabdus argentea TaxID=1387174 RepID=UPI0030EC9F36
MVKFSPASLWGPTASRTGASVSASVPAILPPVILLGAFVALGANDFLLGTAASLASFVTAALMLALQPPGREFWQRLTPVAAPFALALIWASIPAVVPASEAHRDWVAPGAFIPSVVTSAGMLVWLLVGALMGAKARLGKRSLDVFLILAALWIIGSMVAYRINPGYVWAIRQGLPRPRFSATFLNPNAAGCATAMICVLAAGRFVLAAHRVVRRFGKEQQRELVSMAISWVVTILAFFATVMTGSRLAALLAATGLLLIVLQARRLTQVSRAYYLMFGAALLLPLVGGAAVGGLRLAYKMAALSDDLELRLEDLRFFWRMSVEAPWFGHGLGAFRTQNMAMLGPADVLHRWNFGAAHNVLLHAAIEGGWPFALLEVAGIVAAAVLIARARASVPFDSSMYSLILAILIALICGLSDVALNVPALVGFTAWLGGLALGRSNRLRR